MKERARYAAVIGVDQYRNGIAELRSAVHDARQLAHALETTQGYAKPEMLLDSEATLEGCARLLEQDLPKRVEPDSALVVYFAGHGVARGDGEEGPRGFLLPQDAHPAEESTWLSMERAREALEKLDCRHLLVILDCCFAGSFRWSSSRSLVPVGRPLYDSQYQRFVTGKAWQVLTSASHNEKAMDVVPGRHDTRDCVSGDGGEGRSHSPFAEALLRGLAGEADSSRGRHEPDGVITATELYQYVFEELVPAGNNAAARQTPGLWPLKPDNTGEFVFYTPGKAKNTRKDPELDDENNPWLGLAAYTDGDANLFFGREKVVDELVERVLDDTRSPFLAVVGASGAGKSSVVRAGVMPRLERGSEDDDTQGADTWAVAQITTLGRRPDRELETKLAELGRTAPHRRQLLVIDQFEELYTQCRDETARERFLDLLRATIEANFVGSLLAVGDTDADASRTAGPGVSPTCLKVVITLRSDFEPRLAGSEQLGGFLDDGRFVVPQPTSEELRRIVEEPAKVKALYFEPESLIGELIDDVMTMPGALPLLSFSLAEVYRRALERRRRTGENDRALTRADYEATGGVVGAIHRRATEIYEACSPKSQAAIRRLFLRLVNSAGGRLARRRVRRAELEFEPPEDQRVRGVLRRYERARLLVADDDFVVPAHDTLVLAWDKLLGWLARYGHQTLRRELWDAAEGWREAREAPVKGGTWWWTRWFESRRHKKKAEARLWHHDSRLGEIEHLYLGHYRSWPKVLADVALGYKLSSAERRKTILGDLSRLYKALWAQRWRRPGVRLALFWRSVKRIGRELSLGGTGVKKEVSGELNKLEKAFVEAGQERRQALHARSVRWGFAALVIVLLAGDFVLGSLSEARRQRLRTQNQIRVLLAGQLVDQDATLAAALLREVDDPVEVPWAVSKILATLRRPIAKAVIRDPGGVARAGFSPDGTRVATWNFEGEPRLWTSKGVPDVGDDADLETFHATSRDPRLLGPRLKLWPDGSVTWDPLDGSEPFILRIRGRIREAASDRSGRHVLTLADDGTAAVWTLEARPGLEAPERPIRSVATSADGHRAAVVYEDGSLLLYGAGGAIIADMGSASRRSGSVALAADGSEVSALDELGQTLWVWSFGDAPSPLPELRTYRIGKPGQRWRGLRLSARGRRVLGRLDGVVQVWERNGRGGLRAAATLGEPSALTDALFDASGAYVLTLSEHRVVRLWSSKSGKPRHRHELAASVAAVVPDARGEGFVALSGGKARIWQWEGNGAEPRAELARPGVLQARYSDDGEQVLTLHGGEDPESAERVNRVNLWTRDGRWLAEIGGGKDPVRDAAFSHGGDQLVTHHADGGARFWRVSAAGLGAAIRQATTVCVEPEYRLRWLGDSLPDAWRGWKQCQREQKRHAVVELWESKAPDADESEELLHRILAMDIRFFDW